MNMEPLKLSSSRALFGIDPHSGSVYPHSGCLCYEGMEGGTPDNRGALKVVLCEKGGGAALVNMEPLKLYSSRALFGIDPHSRTKIGSSHQILLKKRDSYNINLVKFQVSG